jgi:adenosylcobinamide-GDP ribazoletransferase
MKCTLPLALTFLTILPWPRLGPAGPQELARSLVWFPWVGALLGLIFWGAWLGLAKLLPVVGAAAVLLGLTVIITRGLHLDGLADTADGLGGGSTPEERLRIMKDSRIGAFGVISLILVLLMKFAFFLAWAQTGMAGALLLYPVVSRWGMVLLAFLSPYARPEGGLGQAMTTGVSSRILAGATLSALLLTFLAAGVWGPVVLGVAGAAAWLGSRYFQKKLGGITGDVLGAANELLEVLALGGFLLLNPSGPDIPGLMIFW